MTSSLLPTKFCSLLDQVDYKQHLNFPVLLTFSAYLLGEGNLSCLNGSTKGLVLSKFCSIQLPKICQDIASMIWYFDFVSLSIDVILNQTKRDSNGWKIRNKAFICLYSICFKYSIFHKCLWHFHMHFMFLFTCSFVQDSVSHSSYEVLFSVWRYLHKWKAPPHATWIMVWHSCNEGNNICIIFS